MEELPEWKKEFLERRKNLSKTSNGSTPNSSPKKKVSVELATSPVQTSPHTSPKKYSHQPIGSTYSSALVGHSLLNQSPHSHGSAAGVSKSLYSQYAQQPQNEHHESENVRNQVEVYSRSGSCGNNNVKNLLPSKINNSKKYESNNNFDVIKSSFNKFQTSESSENYLKNSIKTSANKMVAAGEIINEQQMNQFDSDEASEELKYGPGIVSKLRCRYLSLTLRQATVKQRPTINNLRRTTSLNNLLDEDEEEDVDGDDDEHHNGNKIQDHHEKHIIGKYVRCVSENYKNGDENLKLKNTEIYHNQRNSRSNEKSSEMRLKNRHDSMKRARSVEAILRFDHHSWDRDVQKENNMNRMSQEYVGFKNREVTIEDKIINARERNDPKPKRLTSLIDEDERPPPDVVKQTMLIFESNANKKRNPVTRPIGSEVAAKVATFKTIISQEKPAVVFPKPTINAKKPNIIPRTTSPKPIISNMKNNNSVNINNNCAKFVKEKPVLPKLDINIIKNNLETKTNGVTSPTNGNKNNLLQNVNSDYRISKDLSATSGSESPMSTPNILSPFRNSMTPSPQFDVNAGTRKISATNGTVVDSPMSLLSNKLNNIHLMESTTPKNIVQTVPQKINTKTDDSESDIDESDEGNSSDSSDKIKVKKISQTALENISKAGTTQQFKFTSNTNNLSNNNSNNINNSNSISNDCNIKQLPVSNNSVNNISEPVAPEKQVKIINSEVESSETVKSVREIKAPSVPPPLPPIASARSLLTTREIEKNSINKEKDLNEAPIVPPRESKIAGASSASASSSANANAGAVASTAVSSSNPPKWSAKKKNWNQEPENNTMVFNFSDRKDVPDYIENDGLILRRKRELPKPNESGFIFLGDMVLETSTDPDDGYQMGPPSPCDVEFENANIIIDGKSSIRTRVKEVKCKIKFDDSLTATFEYPSENSMMIDDFLEWDVESDYMKTQSGSPSKLLTSVPLGSAPFANYTPTKGSSASASFELGVTKAPSPSTASSDSTDSIEDQPENIPTCVNGENSEYLKPASDDQTVMWSEGTRATDLLF